MIFNIKFNRRIKGLNLVEPTIFLISSFHPIINIFYLSVISYFLFGYGVLNNLHSEAETI